MFALGNFPLPIKRRYPDNERDSSMIPAVKTLNFPSIYEYVSGSGIQTFTLPIPQSNC